MCLCVYASHSLILNVVLLSVETETFAYFKGIPRVQFLFSLATHLRYDAISIIIITFHYNFDVHSPDFFLLSVARHFCVCLCFA